MSNYVHRFWNDEAGFILSAELVLVLTIGVLGLVVGLTQVQSAIVYELNDLSFAFRSLNQSYATSGYYGCKGTFSGGSIYYDRFVGVHCGVVATGYGNGVVVGGYGNGYGAGYGNGVVVGGYGASGVVTGAKIVEQSTAISAGVSTPTSVEVQVIVPPAGSSAVRSATEQVVNPAAVITSECVPGPVTSVPVPAQHPVPHVLPPQHVQPEHSAKPGKQPHHGGKK